MKENTKQVEEQISILRQQMVEEIAAAHTRFAEREIQIFLGKEDRLASNIKAYDETKSRVALVFKNTPQPTWGSYKAAEAIRVIDLKLAEDSYKKAEENINGNYLKQLSDIKLEREQQIIDIERRCAKKIVTLKSAVLDPVTLRLDAKKNYQRQEREAYDVFYSTTCTAKQRLAQQVQEAFNLYCKLYKIEEKKLYDVLDYLRLERYQMLAQSVGLDDISDDVLDNVTKSSDPYAKVQPLLTYTDLRLTLLQTAKPDSSYRIIDILNRIFHEPITFETKRLSEAVNLLHSALNSEHSSDVLSTLMKTVDGFKEYIAETMSIYNKEMISEAGFVFFRLTNTHLCRCAHYDYCNDEATPFRKMNKATREVQYIARLQYEYTQTQAEEAFKKESLDAERIENEAYSNAMRIYEDEMAAIEVLSSDTQTIARDDLYPKFGENKPAAIACNSLSSTGADSSMKVILAIEELDKMVMKIVPLPIEKVGFLMLNGKTAKKSSRFVTEKHKPALDPIAENIYSDEDDDDFDAEISAIFEQGLQGAAWINHQKF